MRVDPHDEDYFSPMHTDIRKGVESLISSLGKTTCVTAHWPTCILCSIFLNTANENLSLTVMFIHVRFISYSRNHKVDGTSWLADVKRLLAFTNTMSATT